MTAEQPEDRAALLKKALQWLVLNLDNVAPLNPDKNPNNEDPYFYEREQIIKVVALVTEFLMSFPELDGKGWEDPLFTLEARLQDVQEGLKVQFFSPPRQEGRPKPSTVDQLTRAHAAAAMQLFTEVDGCTNEKAARRVARRLDLIGGSRLFTGKSEPYQQVERWRQKVMRTVSDDAGQYYQNLVAMGKATGLSPEQAGMNLLEILPRKSF